MLTAGDDRRSKLSCGDLGGFTYAVHGLGVYGILRKSEDHKNGQYLRINAPL